MSVLYEYSGRMFNKIINRFRIFFLFCFLALFDTLFDVLFLFCFRALSFLDWVWLLKQYLWFALLTCLRLPVLFVFV